MVYLAGKKQRCWRRTGMPISYSSNYSSEKFTCIWKLTNNTHYLMIRYDEWNINLYIRIGIVQQTFSCPVSGTYVIKSFNVSTSNMLVIFVATYPKLSTECFVRRQALGTIPSRNRARTVPPVNY